MNGAIGRVQEKEEDEEPEETSGPKPILPYTSMFVFKSEDQIRVACHYIGNVAIRCLGFLGKVSSITLHHGNFTLPIQCMHDKTVRSGPMYCSAISLDC